jgi:hypothetical protein
MKMMLRWALFAAVGAIVLVACDPAAPPSAALPESVEPTEPAEPVEREATTDDEMPSDGLRETLTEMVRDEDAFSRARRLGTLLPTLGPESVPTVKQVLMDPTLALYLGATEIELLARSWATHQPEDASTWAVERAPSAYRVASVFSTLPLWAKEDPQAALEAAKVWAGRADVSEAVQIALVLGWIEANEPAELEEFIQSLGVSFARQRALSNYVRAMLGKHGSEVVIRWAEAVPDDDEKYKLAVYRQVTNALAMFDVEVGQRWCAVHCDGPYGQGMRAMIVGHWLRGDGTAALAWLSGAPEGQDKDVAVRAAFGKWAALDREAAMDWMVNQTAGEPDPWLQPAYPVYAKFLAEESPADAIVWAERTEDDADREAVLIAVTRAWFKVDESAAEAWLLRSSLSEEAREKARASKGKPAPNR